MKADLPIIVPIIPRDNQNLEKPPIFIERPMGNVEAKSVAT
jgi:hypothetical protein